MKQKPSKQTIMDLTLPVLFLKEEGSIVAYTPALDLSTAGKNLPQAKRRFEEAVTIFFQEIEEQGTTEEVLAELGWTRKARPSPHWVPPQVIGRTEEHIRVPMAG